MPREFKPHETLPHVFTATLTKNKFSIFDEEDLNIISEYSWYCTSGGYAATRSKDKHLIYMHRLILNPNKNEEIDHINGDRLDNRKINLRICSSSDNSKNTKKRGILPSSSKYKGVYFHKGTNMWHAAIRNNEDRIFIEYFLDEEYAARAYDLKALEIHGEFSSTNFKYKDYDLSFWKDFIESIVNKQTKTSQFKGVQWNKRSNNWIAVININKKRKRKHFSSELEAYEWYKSQKDRL